MSEDLSIEQIMQKSSDIQGHMTQAFEHAVKKGQFDHPTPKELSKLLRILFAGVVECAESLHDVTMVVQRYQARPGR